jgi:alpha-amylase
MRPSRTRTVAAAVTALATAALTTAALAAPATAATPAAARTQVVKPAASGNDVIANLFMWPWTSVSSECTSVLGPDGYGAVQVAPPEDSISVPGHPWWDIYQPAAYDLNSRMGNRSQFASMVSTCHAAGVKVYVDAVINHMTGYGQSTTTSYGGATFTNTFSYPSAGYTSADFHNYPQDCPESDDQIHDYSVQAQVQECQLDNLSDLRTESDHVRSTIAGYLSDLISLGVDGFRVDASKHINVNDIAAIKAKLTTQPSLWAQEVIPGSPAPMNMPTYEQTGSLLEFNYAYDIKAQFTGDIANLQTFGPSWGLEPSNKAVAMVENHDTERDGSTLSYKDGATDTLANVFMLAWNYGTPNVMSSFDFSNTDQSPPADANGFVTPVTCGSGWVCQQRNPAIVGAVGFHNATRAATGISNWWSDGANEIAFSRGTSGWIALNNSGGSLVNHTFTTGLPAGTYCDVIHGTVSGGACTGPVVVVASNGTAVASVGPKDAVAIDANSKVGAGASATTVSFNDNATTAWGQNVFVVGSVPGLGNWNTADAIPLSSAGYPIWSGSVPLPANTSVQYKYIKKDASGTVTWEGGNNHVFTTPGSGTASRNDTWQ